MSREIDRLLIQRIRRGDSTAWNELDRLYRGRLRSFIRRKLRDAAAVEDVVQETFLGLFNSLPNFDEHRDLETWLFTIATHKVADHCRRQGRLPVPLPVTAQEEEDPTATLPDLRQRAASSIARSLEQREQEAEALGRALRDFIGELLAKGDYLRLKGIELMYVKGWRNQEVAQFLQVSEQDAANWRYQAKTRLRQRLIAARLSPELFPELQDPSDPRSSGSR